MPEPTLTKQKEFLVILMQIQISKIKVHILE